MRRYISGESLLTMTCRSASLACFMSGLFFGGRQGLLLELGAWIIQAGWFWLPAWPRTRVPGQGTYD